jgi:hypothetical protein
VLLPAGAVGAGLTQQGHEVVIEAGAGESAGDQRDCAAADAVEHATICGIAVIQTSPCGLVLFPHAARGSQVAAVPRSGR